MDESLDKPVEMEVEKAMEGTDPKIDELPDADRGIPTETTELDCFVCWYDHEEGNCPLLDWTAEQFKSGYHDLKSKSKRPKRPPFRCAVCGSDPEKDGKCFHVSWIPYFVYQEESGPFGEYRNKWCKYCHQYGHWEKKCLERQVREHLQRQRGVKPNAEHVPEVPGGVKTVNHGDSAGPSQVPEYINTPFSQLEITTRPANSFRCLVCGIFPEGEEDICCHLSHALSGGGEYIKNLCINCGSFDHRSLSCPRETTDSHSQFREVGSMKKLLIDPFANGLGAGTKESVHIRMQLQQNGRKSLTTVQGLKKDSWYNKMIKDLEEFCHCNGTVVVQDPEQGQVIQLDGDQRKNVSTFLIQAGLVEKEHIKIHGL